MYESAKRLSFHMINHLSYFPLIWAAQLRCYDLGIKNRKRKQAIGWDRRYRQQQGIVKVKAESKYVGRRKNVEKRKIIASLLKSGHSYSDIQKTAKCSRQLIAIVSKELKDAAV